MIEKVRKFLCEYKIKDTTVIAGLSGGCDSVVMLHLLAFLKDEFNLKIIAAHLNHNWRGDESKRDEEFSGNYAKKTGVEFYCETLNSNVKKTEVCAREARYDFFQRCAEKFGSSYVFLAHNKNDNAETVLYRIIKGTGLKGLCAIAKKRDIYARPLLDVTRAQIENYAKENALEFVDDSSNEDTKYKRNLIRHEILPALKKINPDVINALDNLSKLSNLQYEILQNATEEAKNKVFSDDKIIIAEFLKLNYAMQLEIMNDFLHGDLKSRDFKRVSSYVDFIKFQKGKKSINSELFLEVADGFAYKTKPSENIKNMLEIQINGGGIYKFGKKKVYIEQVQNVCDFCPPDNAKFLNLDFEKSLILRTRRAGDVFSPYGMTGSMKLKDYLINQKIARQERDNLLLLAHKNEILCILGMQISQKAAVLGSECYKITIRE